MPASKLGPLAGRTLGGGSSSAASGKSSPKRSPSASGTAVGAAPGSGHSATSSSFASGPVSSPSSSKSHGYRGAADGKRSDLVDAASGSHTSQQKHQPYLLPREQETSTHRRLRSLLLDAHRLRSTWRDEVDETGEVVARFAGVVAELEDELRAEEERLRETSKRRRGASKSFIQVEGIEIAGNEDGAGHAAVVVESLRELQTVHFDLTKALQRMTRCVDAMVKVKDDLHELERTVAGAAWSDVTWSARVAVEDLGESRISKRCLAVCLLAAVREKKGSFNVLTSPTRIAFCLLRLQSSPSMTSRFKY